MRVAFLGLGVMGQAMAGRLLQAGFPVQVWNRSPGRADDMRSAGAAVASSPAQAAKDADVIISMVADDGASRAVWTGDAGALAGAKRGAIAVECSTLSPPWVVELAALCSAGEVSLIDAPVTGSRPQAAAGELLFLAGGDAQTLDRISRVLRVMGRDVVHLGPTGSGARMKLVNNVMSAVQASAFAEALAVIEASGLDRALAVSVLFNGAPGSPIVKTVGARMIARDYAVNFLLPLMRKDITYAIDEAARHGVTLRTAAAARELFDAALAAGLKDVDFAAIAEVVPGKPRQAGAGAGT
jgi:3-hydroxyisobutyrate dehydrogenase